MLMLSMLKNRHFPAFSGTRAAVTVIMIFILNGFAGAVRGDVVLIGDNSPWGNVKDGDFDLVPGWAVHDSPHWRVNETLSKGEQKAGVAKNVFTTRGKTLTVVESYALNSADYPTFYDKDTLSWHIALKAEHKSEASVSLSLMFGDREVILSAPRALNGGPAPLSSFSGTYKMTKADVNSPTPVFRVYVNATAGVSVFIHNVDIKVLDKGLPAPQNIQVSSKDGSNLLQWKSKTGNTPVNIYRKAQFNKNYTKIGNTKTTRFEDTSVISGVEYKYVLTYLHNLKESNASAALSHRQTDNQAPTAPKTLSISPLNTEIELSWNKTDNDTAYYQVFRKNSAFSGYILLADNIRQNKFVDLIPTKEELNDYKVRAVDYSGNTSKMSDVISAQVKAVNGAAFSDLIKPMPILSSLRSDLWGADNVLPRDPHNGMEHPDWSYWGGNPVLDDDGKYHMQVVRWPENALRGHWEWSDSTVAHVVSDHPVGPYSVVKDTAYDYANGKGHNADIILMNDGSYLLYSLINWKPTLLKSKSMNGSWELVGEMTIEYDANALGDEREYQVQRNLSGVQLDDGSMLFVSKFGRMIKSDTLLGPYKVLTDVINNNETIPEWYRKSNYEDPVMWRDDVQFHMIINAFLDYRAIYLRSKDGIHWQFETGIAYTPTSTVYEDGTRTHWYKLERPHVLQDKFGRATHLSLAAIDTVKRQDFANDKHSSKNLIIPLTVTKRIEILGTETTGDGASIVSLLIKQEKGFNPENDINVDTLQFGASQKVNFGNGASAVGLRQHDDGLVLLFNKDDLGLDDSNFTAKLIGKTSDGELLVGYAALHD